MQQKLALRLNLTPGLSLFSFSGALKRDQDGCRYPSLLCIELDQYVLH